MLHADEDDTDDPDRGIGMAELKQLLQASSAGLAQIPQPGQPFELADPATRLDWHLAISATGP
jgi:hypothetical protein